MTPWGKRASRAGLWLRWSWRDLRSRWLQVLAIAVIIAIGSGVYSGLSSNTVWRRQSYDASYRALRSHDLTATTAEGTFAAQGALEAAVAAMEHPEWVHDAEERLVVSTQVDAREISGKALMVPGRIVGVDVTDDGPHVDSIELVGGRSLREPDDGEPVVILDSHFARHHDLPPEGKLALGAGPVSYVGTGYTPEYFMVSTETMSFLAEAGFAVLFAPLGTAQQLAGAPDQVNQLAVRLADGVDAAAAVSELETALAEVAPDLAVEVSRIEDERMYRRLYDDIEGDQRLFNIFAVLILGGAAFAAFNLTSRIVEAQRREIGVGMAIGVERWKLAVRPLLVAFQISLLGVLAGVGFGLWIGVLISDLNLQFLPMPVWNDDFQPLIFLRGAALGLVITFAATVFPVRRAIRVDPVDAIHPRGGITRTGGLAPLLRRVPLPGNSVNQFPFRNVVREPRRTILTAFGIAAVIAVLITLVGMLDSFLTTIDRGEKEILGDAPERASVTLDFFYATDAPEVSGIAGVPEVAVAEPRLDLGGWFLTRDGDEIETLLTFVDLSSDLWRPTAVEGSLETDEPAVVISRKAADDLGAEPGERVRLRHPRREGLGYSFVESEVLVAAIHPNPYRFITYLDIDHADLVNLEGIVNSVSVQPVEGKTADDLKLELFGDPGVAAVEGVNEVARSIRDALEDFLGFLTLIEGFVLMMALLIAFNTTSISSDERRREHATMFAFGMPVRSVMRLTVMESFLVGVLGTAIGIVAGRLLLGWMVRFLIPSTVPDIGIVLDVAGSTYLMAAVLGILVVSVAPLLTWRRMRRMDIPATLRVVE